MPQPEYLPAWGSPTYEGMFLYAMTRERSNRKFPHIRGDEPDQTSMVPWYDWQTPHPRESSPAQLRGTYQTTGRPERTGEGYAVGWYSTHATA